MKEAAGVKKNKIPGLVKWTSVFTYVIGFFFLFISLSSLIVPFIKMPLIFTYLLIGVLFIFLGWEIINRNSWARNFLIFLTFIAFYFIYFQDSSYYESSLQIIIFSTVLSVFLILLSWSFFSKNSKEFFRRKK